MEGWVFYFDFVLFLILEILDFILWEDTGICIAEGYLNLLFYHVMDIKLTLTTSQTSCMSVTILHTANCRNWAVRSRPR